MQPASTEAITTRKAILFLGPAGEGDSGTRWDELSASAFIGVNPDHRPTLPLLPFDPQTVVVEAERVKGRHGEVSQDPMVRSRKRFILDVGDATFNPLSGTEGIILQSKTNNQIWTGVVWEGHRSGVRTNAPNPLAPQAYHRMGR